MWKLFKNGLDKFLEIITTVSMGVLVIDVTWQVITRFILKHPSNWTEELATYLMIWVGLLGAAVALNRGAHLGIDYFVGKLPIKTRMYSEIFAFACTGAFSISVLLIGGLKLVSVTFRWNQLSPALGLKMGYVYLSVPIAGFFLTLYSLEFMVERIISLRKLHLGN